MGSIPAWPSNILFGNWSGHIFYNYSLTSLTLKAPITTAADDILKYFFFIFQRKQVLIFHVNRLLGRRFTWSIKTCFLWKDKKKKIKINVIRYKFCLALYGLIKNDWWKNVHKSCWIAKRTKPVQEKCSWVYWHYYDITFIVLTSPFISNPTSHPFSFNSDYVHDYKQKTFFCYYYFSMNKELNVLLELIVS